MRIASYSSSSIASVETRYEGASTFQSVNKSPSNVLQVASKEGEKKLGGKDVDRVFEAEEPEQPFFENTEPQQFSNKKPRKQKPKLSYKLEANDTENKLEKEGRVDRSSVENPNPAVPSTHPRKHISKPTSTPRRVSSGSKIPLSQRCQFPRCPITANYWFPESQGGKAHGKFCGSHRRPGMTQGGKVGPIRR